MAKRSDLTAEDLVERLRARYCAPEWAFFAELRGGTGFSREGRMDGMAMNLYPSRGLAVLGFEVKVSRSDWLRELKAPEKSAQLQRFCDSWWVVLSDAEIIQPGERPPTWGVMVAHGERLRVVHEAPPLTAEPLDRTFVAALVRRASSDDAVKRAVDAAVRAESERQEKLREQWAESDRKADQQHIAHLEKTIADFEAASGLRISEWRAGDIGAAVKLVMEARGQGGRARTLLERLAADAKKISDMAAEAVEKWPKEA